VNVRGATWAVTDIRPQGLPRSPADEGEPGLTHVVQLQSLEEDRLVPGTADGRPHDRKGRVGDDPL
jgi:hypothetical protein